MPGRADPKMAAVVVAPRIGAEPGSRLGNCGHNVTNNRPNPDENESAGVMSVQPGFRFLYARRDPGEDSLPGFPCRCRWYKDAPQGMTTQ